MTIVSEAEVLSLWETAADRAAPVRALALAVAGGADPADIADVTVGLRDGYLITLREACFGGVYGCVVDCPGCGVELEPSCRWPTCGPPHRLTTRARCVSPVSKSSSARRARVTSWPLRRRPTRVGR
jgi:hypothetical protein